ncbi:MAG TPA: Crp/Fnr family transcriptional regulator [Thiomicrorhabdus sp.]|nr:Crp/Fnr family transcriptional regulator [Thiomicrorhabdus sp.]
MNSVKTGILHFLKNQQVIKTISLPPNTTVCSLGDLCENFVVLTKGKVKVFRISEDGRLFTLYQISTGEGCVLTASCLLNEKAFPAHAITEEITEGYLVPKHIMRTWLKTEPEWQAFIFDLLAIRMGDLIEIVDQLAFDSLETRLKQWLTTHAHNASLTTTHQKIAEELASSREVISRLLKKLEYKGFVKLQRGKIHLIIPPK